MEFEVEKRFAPKKLLSILLSESYGRLRYDERSRSVVDCGSFLEFQREVVDGRPGRSRLSSANFCRDRLCPMCSWRRSYKVFGQISKVMDVIADDYAFIFVTLTVPNCFPRELPDLLDRMQKGWYLFNRMKRVKAAVKGFFRAVEVTHNLKKDTYHPHYHCIIAVDKGYFKSRQYLKHDEWLDCWRKAMNDPTITQVDVRRCRAKEMAEDGEPAAKSLASAVSEAAKYSVKASDYLYDDAEQTDNSVKILLTSLYGRRLCSFGGCFDMVRKQLNLDDCEDGDLVHLDDLTIRPDVAVQILRYGWSCGVYKLIFVQEQLNDQKVNIDVEYED